MPLGAVHGLDGVDDSLLVLVSAGGQALCFGSLQTFAEQHGGVIGQRRKHVGDLVDVVSSLVVLFELLDGVGAGRVAEQ